MFGSGQPAVRRSHAGQHRACCTACGNTTQPRVHGGLQVDLQLHTLRNAFSRHPRPVLLGRGLGAEGDVPEQKEF